MKKILILLSLIVVLGGCSTTHKMKRIEYKAFHQKESKQSKKAHKKSNKKWTSMPKRK